MKSSHIKFLNLMCHRPSRHTVFSPRDKVKSPAACTSEFNWTFPHGWPHTMLKQGGATSTTLRTRETDPVVQLSSNRYTTRTSSRCNFSFFLHSFGCVHSSATGYNILYFWATDNWNDYCCLTQLSATAPLNNWFNPHRFWNAGHISIRSTGPTYCTN